jgi:hypothetical protein
MLPLEGIVGLSLALTFPICFFVLLTSEIIPNAGCSGIPHRISIPATYVKARDFIGASQALVQSISLKEAPAANRMQLKAY